MSYNQFEIHRKVRRAHNLPDGVIEFVTYSFTTKGTEIEYQLHVCTQTGEVHCSCDDFRFRRVKGARLAGTIPNVLMPQFQCKHVKRAICNCVAHGELVKEGDKILPAHAAPVARALHEYQQHSAPQAGSYTQRFALATMQQKPVPTEDERKIIRALANDF